MAMVHGKLFIVKIMEEETMGFAKELWQQQQDQGFDFVGDKYVCAECFGDCVIQEFIDDNAEAKTCSYCGNSSSRPIAAHMDTVMAFILEGIEFEWGDPDNEGVLYETAEGGYQGKVIDSWDLITDEIWDELEIRTDSLREDIINSIRDRQWCQRNFWELEPEQALIFSWEQFVQQVKYHARYVFFRVDDDSDTLWDTNTTPLSKMLDELGRMASDLDLVEVLEPGTRIWRVRIHDKSERFDTAKELGTVPPDKAKYSNRMSPAGIPMFYGALDELTALKETVEGREQDSTIATIAPWRIIHQMRVLNLERLPKVPSLFDESKRESRPRLQFLYSFRNDISKPIIKDGQEHIEHVPTQIVAEYFRHMYRDTEGNRVTGILYPSARNSGGIACVLFVKNEGCCDTLDEAQMDGERGKQKYLLLEKNQIKGVTFEVRCGLNVTGDPLFGS